MRVGIIGNSADKFTAEQERKAREVIRIFLADADELISGGCHLGGIDIWAEEEAKKMSIKTRIFKPDIKQWNPINKYGYMKRNIDIAKNSDRLHIILSNKYPENYKGMKFKKCYHCNTDKHIKSGACWTAKQAEKLNKKVFYYVI